MSINYTKIFKQHLFLMITECKRIENNIVSVVILYLSNYVNINITVLQLGLKNHG